MDKHNCPKNVAIIVDGRVIEGCELCIGLKQQQGVSANYERNWQKREYARDLVQPNQPDKFVRAYGVEVARKAGYSDEQIRKYS